MTRIEIKGVGLEIKHIGRDIAEIGARPEKSPLVFLHEGLGSVALWRNWPEQLCRMTGREGWIYSRQGYGQSDPVPDFRGPSRSENGRRIGRLLPDYMHVQALEVLPALLKELAIERPVLVGHSDGASIALLYASLLPVSACVVMAPHVIVEDVSIAAITQARTAYEQGDLRARLARYHADVDCAFWQWNDVWLSPAFRAFDIRDNCRTISAPLLAIQGQDDPYGTMRQIEEIAVAMSAGGPMKGVNPRCTLEKIAHCGHSPHHEQRELCLQLVAEFLARAD